MREQDVIKKALRTLKITQTKLAERLGYASQAGVAQIVGRDRKSITVQLLAKVVDAMGCELVIRSKSDPSLEWIITAEEESK